MDEQPAPKIESPTPANPQQTSPPPSSTNSSPITRKRLLSMPLKTFLFLLIVGSLVGAYYMGFVRNTPQPIPSPSPVQNTNAAQSPAPTQTTPGDSGIPITAGTVSFTRVNGQIFMRYKGKIYSEEAANKNDPSLTKLPNPDSHTWYGLVDAPNYLKTKSFDELFDFRTLPNKSDFIFIMRWTRTDDSPETNDHTDYTVFHYDAYKTNNKVIDILNFIDNGEGEEQNVPRIKQISSDGRFMAFDMFSCWNCGGHAPDTLLFSMDAGLRAIAARSVENNEKVVTRIGKTSYFNWKDKGAYEYKEYKVITCDPPLEGPGECSEDPANLPLLTGAI